jgi:antitoxin component of MazEF toxin-antitoxin module
MRVAKWGKSLPAAVVEALRLKEGDEIDIDVAGEREFAVARKPKPRRSPEPAAPLSRSPAAGLQVRPRSG